METHEIRYFLAMVRELSFTRAAAACNVSQPALTRAIQKLEAEFGGALFLRRPGQIELTRLSRELLPRLEAIEQGLSAVRDQASAIVGAQASTLRLGVMCTVGPIHLVTMLARVQEAIRDVEISIVDATAGRIVDLLATDQIDIGLTAWPAYPPTIGVEPLLTERYVVAMREDDLLASESTIPVERLAGQSYIERLGCEFDDYFEALHGHWPVDLNITYSSEREDWVKGLLLSGLGCAIIPEFMEMPKGIVKRPLVEPEVARTVGLATLRGRPLGPAAMAFSRIARAYKWQP
jgi:DNA-binding transcriptional LysR family regulator